MKTKRKVGYSQIQVISERQEEKKFLAFEEKFWAMFRSFLFLNGKGSFAIFNRLWIMQCSKANKDFKYIKPDPSYFFVNMICHWI